MTFRSFAKINLHLQVMGRREDGYHELETLFQSVDLADLVTLELNASDIRLTVSEGEAPAGAANLAYSAAQRFLQRWAPDAGLRIDLKKRIPVGGGLGGGSSNAATVLVGLQRLLGEPAQRGDLLDLAAGLGADVPYFLWGGTALGLGRGDRIEPLPELAERPIWLVTPPLRVSTAEVFGDLTLGESTARSWRGDGSKIGDLGWRHVEQGWNDLQETVLDRFPVMRDVYNVLVEAGATVVRLSGTGATLFALFESGVQTSALATVLPSGSRVVQTRTLTRASLDRLRVVQ